MKFGITFAVHAGRNQTVGEMFQTTVEQIQLAESCGFDVAFISEHHFLPSDMLPSPLIALAYVAAKTSSIRLGTGILLMPLHDPVRVAEDAAVIDVISGGRMLLGIGQGYRPEEFEGFGRRLEDRRALMREGATLVRRAWTETSVDFEGEHFQAQGLNVTPKPLQKPSPPIWVGAKIRRAVELAAEIGDGWYADPITPIPIIARNKEHWLNAIRANGKDPEKQDFAYYREFFVGPDDDTGWRIGGRGQLSEYRAYLSFNHLVDDEGKPIPADQSDGLEDLVRQRCTAGGPERCRDDLLMIKETLDPTHVIMKTKYSNVSNEDVAASIRLASEKVFPAVASATS